VSATVSLTLSGLGRIYGSDFRRVLDLARAADDAGVDQIVLPDHVVMGPRTDRYPFGVFPYPPEEPWPEPLIVLAAMAGVTTRVRLSTGILIAPLRPAVLLAKTAATLDVLSGGRLDLGVGSGWQREEFWASGIGWADREQRLDDTVAACRVLWRDAPASFASPTVSFADVWCRPGPLQTGGIPVWFGGGATERTARRIAILGDGWLPMAGMPVDELATGVARVSEECERAGRDPGAVGVRAGLAGVKGPDGRPDVERTLEAAAELADLGVTGVSIALGRFVRTADDVPAFFDALGRASRAG
jgi:probable F420-dependent oxidoreductase